MKRRSFLSKLALATPVVAVAPTIVGKAATESLPGIGGHKFKIALVEPCSHFVTTYIEPYGQVTFKYWNLLDEPVKKYLDDMQKAHEKVSYMWKELNLGK